MDDEQLESVEIPLEEMQDILGEEDIEKIEDEVGLVSEGGHFENLVERIDDEQFLMGLGRQVVDRFTRDKDTRTPLETTLRLGFEGLNPSTNLNMNLPFEGACDITHPLIRENAVKYQSKFCKALLPPQGPFNIDILDVAIPKIEQRAAKYNKKLNWIARTKMNYSGEQARLYLYMSLTGTAFKKVYYNYTTGYPCSEFVKIEDFVVSDMARDLESAECHTHQILRSSTELKKNIASGLYIDIQDDLFLSQPEEDVLGSVTKDAFDEPEISPETKVYTLLEQYVDLDLEGYDPLGSEVDYPLPYQVTVDRNSGKVLSIRRNWKENDPYRKKIINFFEYTMVPATGYYGLGLFHLLGDFQKTLTAITRSLVDSASFSTLQAGFKRKGLRWNGTKEPLKPGEFRDVELLDNTKLSDVLMLLPFKEPSPTLYNLMDYLTKSGQKFADNLEEVVNNSANYGKVGTTMALLEESSQFFSSIFMRVYAQQQKELQYIAELCEEHLGPEFIGDLNGDGIMELTPASDPNYPTRSHRLALAQTKLNLALQAPQVHDIRAAFENFYECLGEPDEIIQKILPAPQQAQPQDPMTDIITAANGGPIKAFEGQDHDAHIAVKAAFMQDPTHQNDLLAPTVQALQANIREHLVLKYSEQMKGVMDAQQVAGEVGQAEAAQQVLLANQNAATQEAAGGGNDPLMVAAKADAMKAQTDAVTAAHNMKSKDLDIMLKAAKIDLDRQKEKNRAIEAGAKLKLEAKKLQTTAGTELLGMAQQDLQHTRDHAVKLTQAKNKPVPTAKPEK